MKSCEGLKGGLNKLAEDLEVGVPRPPSQSFCAEAVHEAH